jgi:hypothetical protein
MTRHDLRNAIVDALEKVCSRQDYYALNHATVQQLCELEDILVNWLQKIGLKLKQ